MPHFDLARAMSELYGARLETFVDKRKELAAMATREGDKRAAETLKKAKKPTRIAWALNRLAHGHGKALDAFFESADALRTAQAQALRGQSADLRGAMTEQRREQERLVALALRELSEAGMGTGAGADRSLQATLHAAAFGSREARQAVQTGRLERELEPESGLEALAGIELPARVEHAEKPTPQPAPKAARDKTDRERERVERERERERQQAEREREKREREQRTHAAKDLQRQAAAKLAEAKKLEQSAKELDQQAALERSRAERARKEAEKLEARADELLGA